MSVRGLYGTLAGHARAPYRPSRMWKSWRFLCGAHTMPVQASHGVPVESCEWFNQTKHTAVSSRTGPVAWCDHGNSTDVKFLRALHSSLRARNRTGDRNCMGPVVGCDWGIMHALKLYGPRTGRQNLYGAARGPCADVWFLFKTAREQPVRGPGVWCDWGIALKLGLQRIVTNLGPICELKIYGFLGLVSSR